MRVFKENWKPTLLILLAGVIVSFAAVPLQNTEWAESIRTEVGSEGGESEGAEEEDGPPGGSVGSVLMVIGPLVKVTILMGIGGLLTALVLWIIRLFKRPRAKAAT